MVGSRVNVKVVAEDPVLQAGVEAQLRGRPEATVVHERGFPPGVIVLASDGVDSNIIRLIRQFRADGETPTVVVVREIDDGGLAQLVEAGARSIVLRCQASPEHLAHVCRRASEGESSMPPTLVGRLVDQMRQLQQHVLGPMGMNSSGLSERETEVLRLLADGLSTAEIASTLSYSERTIKNVLHDVTTRFSLKNRSHAVAYAVRAGLI